MQSQTQTSSQPAQPTRHDSSDYTIQQLDYPTDAQACLDAMEQAFSVDPNTVYINARVKNPKTFTLRNHMRAARFRNTIEGLNPDSKNTETIWWKAIHTPTNSIAGACAWSFPLRSLPSTTPKRDPYPILPPGITMPVEDAALSTLGPRLEALLEQIVSKIPLLGDTSTREKHWWYLAVLGVVPSHNGNRLGSRLVKWGLEQARADAKARPEKGIKGAWVVSTEAGLRTYQNVGFKLLGQARVVYGGLDGDGPGWDVVEINEENLKREGQMAFVLAMEF